MQRKVQNPPDHQPQQVEGRHNCQGDKQVDQPVCEKLANDLGIKCPCQASRNGNDEAVHDRSLGYGGMSIWRWRAPATEHLAFRL